MELLGKHFIGSGRVGNENGFQAIDPSTNNVIPTFFSEGDCENVANAVSLAELAFESYRVTSCEDRAQFLERIALEIENLGDTLIERATLETGLPAQRIEGERGRTVGQLRLFASTLREGSYIDARIDHSDADRQPLRKPDTRLMSVPLGPVAVFGASNFPLAFSVAGGDTASALAAGCPVIVKAHRSHPGVSELIALAVHNAVKACGMHEGVFSMLQGTGRGVGVPLVKHPGIKAVGFTGSLSGGRALFDVAVSREVPIPFYGELASVNPVFLLPHQLETSPAELAKDFVGSLTLGVGQFCTNPGVVIGIKSAAFDQFCDAIQKNIQDTEAGVLLSPGIQSSFYEGISVLTDTGGVALVGKGEDSSEGSRACAHVFKATADQFLANKDLSEEVFGPSSLIVECDSISQMEDIARSLKGQLTATLHAGTGDFDFANGLMEILTQKVGRVLFNGFPTGVEVCSSMNHGGPYPASTDSRSTSVGSAAIKRFVRPVCYQDTPTTLLPLELQDHNPLGIWRMVNGSLTK